MRNLFKALPSPLSPRPRPPSSLSPSNPSSISSLPHYTPLISPTLYHANGKTYLLGISSITTTPPRSFLCGATRAATHCCTSLASAFRWACVRTGVVCAATIYALHRPIPLRSLNKGEGQKADAPWQLGRLPRRLDANHRRVRHARVLQQQTLELRRRDLEALSTPSALSSEGRGGGRVLCI